MKSFTPILMFVACVAGCADPGPERAPGAVAVGTPALEVVAETERQWTGVAVSREGRVFVNFPRWSPEVPVSVAELRADGSLAAFPDQGWNAWSPGSDPASAWVCVQSVVADGEGSLWVLDPANPGFAGVVPGGAKLVEIDIPTGAIIQVIRFDNSVAPPESYLNDVRLDHLHATAYITDSGLGALVVVNLATGGSRRVLADHPSTKAEDTVLVIGGEPWLRPDGSSPQVHADGIAYDRARDLVYYQALTGRTLYRISGAALRDPALDEAALAERVETVVASGPSDGLLWDGADGIFISAIEDDAVKRWRPEGVETVIADPILAWPDSFARGPDGSLYVTTSQIHRGPNPPEPYRLLRITGL
jgi:sugar lactone lactonase YvrE